MKKTCIAAILALALSLSLAACAGTSGGVYVQNVGDLSGFGITDADRFPGVVVAENVTKIQRDADKTVGELFVKAGDTVKTGDQLFSYDTEQLQLNLDKQKLEQEQLEATIENYKDQITELENQRANAGSSQQLAYTVQIQTMQVDLKEAELNLEAKKTDVAKSEALLENAVVTSPVDGQIQAINESTTDQYGREQPYITIQQAGSFRVQGTLGELQRGSFTVGTRVKILSRTNDDSWTGTISTIDYENPTQNNSNNYGFISDSGSSSMNSSSRYPFYVELDSTDGLILGQHVYLALDSGEDLTGLRLSSAFVAFNDDGSTYVWAEKNGKLEKRTVTLGEYDAMTDTYAVTDGLSESDYVAYPDEACVEGAATTREKPAETTPEDGANSDWNNGVDTGMDNGGLPVEGDVNGGIVSGDIEVG